MSPSWLLLSLSLAIAFAENSIQPYYDYENYKLYDIRGSLVLSCNVSLEDKKYTLQWLKGETPVAEVDALKNRHRIINSENKFIIDRTDENDGGIYTCMAEDKRAEIEVIAKPTARLPDNTNVVEGEKLRLHCIGAGNPKPTIEWTIGDETYNESRGRVTLKPDNGVENSILILKDITLDDRGTYYCHAKNTASRFINATTMNDSTFVRVKDNLAALWPFLGICAEVFVLCAIILIYEKRRTKPELEESDTDQSPDQKQTPDHGKERDVRHRK